MDSGYDYIAPDKLRLGLFVDLQLGWMSHPFPKGSFKISSLRQIETLRSLAASLGPPTAGVGLRRAVAAKPAAAAAGAW